MLSTPLPRPPSCFGPRHPLFAASPRSSAESWKRWERQWQRRRIFYSVNRIFHGFPRNPCFGCALSLSPRVGSEVLRLPLCTLARRSLSFEISMFQLRFAQAPHSPGSPRVLLIPCRAETHTIFLPPLLQEGLRIAGASRLPRELL